MMMMMMMMMMMEMVQDRAIVTMKRQ